MRITDPFRVVILGNSAFEWLVSAALLVGAVAALYVARLLAIRRFRRTAGATATKADDYALTFLHRTKFFFVLALALFAVHLRLTLTEQADDVVDKIITVAAGLQAVIWGNALIGYFVDRGTRHGADDGASVTTMKALGVFGRVVLWVIVLLVVLQGLGIQPTALITGLGVSGIAVALAVQNILGDLFGALSIVLDKPFVVGDAIAVDNFDGVVEHIGLKTTRVRSHAGEQIVISNADLLKSRIRNYKRMAERRGLFTLVVEYRTPPDVVAAIPGMLREIVAGAESVRFDRAHFRRFAETGLEYEVVYFVTTPDYIAFVNAQQAINLGILRRFRAANIGFAAERPTVVVTDGARPADSTGDQAITGAGDPSLGRPPRPASIGERIASGE